MQLHTQKPERAFVLSSFLAAGLLVAASFAPGDAAAGTTVGSGRVESQTRAVSDFQSIALHGSLNLVVRQSGKEGVEVRADDNLLPLIETVVEAGSKGRTLKVRWKSGESIRTKEDAVVTVDVKEVNAISAAGSGDVKVEPLKTAEFALSIAGSSDAKLASVTANAFSVSVAGSGDVRAAGQAGTLNIRVSGSGDVNTRELQSDDVTISIAGSGDASVVANKSLKVSIAGSGDVTYTGNATQVSKSVAGSGSVNKR